MGGGPGGGPRVAGGAPPRLAPTHGPAYNNLAVAYEHEGDFDKARQSYEKAVQLEPNNALIKQNYELFKEINDRTTRQDNQ